MAQITLNSTGVASSGSLLLQSNGTTTAVTIDASQNVGLGVTPSASSASGTLFLKNGGQSTYSGPIAYQDVNTVYNSGADRYISNGFATRFSSINGVQAWYNAASGTAGNTISFTQAMTLDSSGNLLVGLISTGTPAVGYIFNTNGFLQIGRASGAAQSTIGFYNGSTFVGEVRTSTTATTYATSSDYRLKENVAPMQNALATVSQLKPVTYNWKANGEASQGFIAHELQEVVPDAVIGEKDGTRIEQYEVSPAVPATYDEDGNELTPAVEAVMGEREVPSYQGIDTSFLVATLTAAIQEQQAIITTLTDRITALEAK